MSDLNAQGIIEYVGRNDAGMYNMKLDDNEWYGCGRNQPDVSKGDVVAFDYVMNGRWKNADVKTIEVISKAATPEKTVKSLGLATGNSREDYWTNKAIVDAGVRKEIRYQASKKSAVIVAQFLVEQGVYNLGKVQSKQSDIFMNYVNGLAVEMNDNVVQFCDVSDPEEEDSAKGEE